MLQLTYGNLEFTDRVSVSAVGQIQTQSLIDIVGKKPNRAVAKQDLQTTGVGGLDGEITTPLAGSAQPGMAIALRL